VTRIVADKHFVNFEDGAKFAVECFGRDMREIEIDLILSTTPLPSMQTWKISRVAISRGTRLPYAGNFSSRKYQRSFSGIDEGARVSRSFRGTQTRPPSPRADSDIKRSLSRQELTSDAPE